MRFRITTSNVGIFGTNNWENIRLDSPYQKVGIFHYGSQSCHGGWIKFPIPMILEFEGSSYIRRNIGNLRVIEITVDTLEQLNQLSHQIFEYLDDWNLPKKIESTPNIHKLIEDTLKRIPKFINELHSIKQKIDTDMTLHESDTINWNNIRGQISTYRTLFSLQELPDKFIEIYEEFQQKLGIYENNFREDEIYSIILHRELEMYSKNYESLYSQYKTENFALDSLVSLLDEMSELEEKINHFWNKMPRNYRQVINQEKDRIVQDISELKTKVQEEHQELERVLEIAQKRAAIEQTVLQQIRHLTPGIQTLLTRLSELTDIEKELVEEAIHNLLEKHSDLGTYHKTSQVFILGKEMTKEINTILGTYPQSSVEDSIKLIEQGIELTNPLNVVVELHKRIKTTMKALLDDTNQIDLVAIIDRVAEEGKISPEEQQILHQFRMSRNRLIHEDEDNFPSELLLQTKQILNRLMNNQPAEKNPKSRRSRW